MWPPFGTISKHAKYLNSSEPIWLTRKEGVCVYLCVNELISERKGENGIRSKVTLDKNKRNHKRLTIQMYLKKKNDVSLHSLVFPAQSHLQH